MDSNKRQQRMRQGVVALRHQFAQAGNGVFANVLPTQEVLSLVSAQVGRYRNRLYPPLTTLRLFIGQVLSEDQACQDVVGRRLSERVAANESGCGLNTGPYCQARGRLPLAIAQRLYQRVGKALEARMPAAWCWRGRRVKLFDGTTVSMPDTVQNQSAFPQSPEQAPGVGFPIARVGGLIGLASGAMLGHVVSACAGKGSGEQSMLRELLPLIEARDVLLADALLATWWIIAEVRARGADVVMVQHGSRITDFSQGKSLGGKDHVVEWPRPARPQWMSVEDYRRYPPTLCMRELEIAGRVLVTTMLDPKALSPQEIDALYGLRWNIEVDWRTIKATMRMDVLRCRCPEMVKKEIAVHLLAYNLVRWTMATAALLADILPRTLSFTGTKRVLLAFVDQLRRCPGRRLRLMFATVLGAIASLTVPDRPKRVEPRAKKRRPKPLPFLTVPRQLAREKIIAQRAARGLNVAP